MKILIIDKKEYQIEFTFGAAECKDLVQKMFNILSGAFIFKHVSDEKSSAIAMIDGTAEMVAEIPHICKVAFYAGFLESNPVTQEESTVLMKKYMKETKLSYNGLYEFLKVCMEEDGFFDLSGLTEMIQKMNESAEENQKNPKETQDHKKKLISTT